MAGFLFERANCMNYEETIAYIHSAYWKGTKDGLSRTRELLALLGDPQDLIIFYQDVPGVISKVSWILALEKINVAFMKVFRSERRQGACMVIETDTPVDEATRQRIVNNVDGIKEACAL